MKNVKEVKIFTLLLIFLTGLGFSNVFGQETESPTLYAVMFHADDCSDSKSLAPKVKALQNELKGKQVEFVKFDLPTNESKEKTKDIANNLGLSNILASYQGTGFVVLVDAKTKKEKAILTAQQSLDEMLAIVIKNL
ncbi:MAG: thioredoxin family protein [Bacteroidales bacterium]|nr:thioredoxin family protein [Bacteroidales bacterium]